MERPKDEALWAAFESNLKRCKGECAAIERDMKTLLVEGRAETDEGRVAQRRRLAELQFVIEKSDTAPATLLPLFFILLRMIELGPPHTRRDPRW